MEYHDRSRFFTVACSERHDKVDDIFNHATDDDMVLGKFRILHGFIDDVLLVHRLRSSLAHIHEVTLHVIHFNIEIFILAFELMEIVSDDGFVIRVEAFKFF